MPVPNRRTAGKSYANASSGGNGGRSAQPARERAQQSADVSEVIDLTRPSVEVLDADGPAGPNHTNDVDEGLATDLAEAHALGIDEGFIEELRIMTPRSRATILTDLRGARPKPQARAPTNTGRPNDAMEAQAAALNAARSRNPRHRPERRGGGRSSHHQPQWQDDDDDEPWMTNSDDDGADMDDPFTAAFQRPPPPQFHPHAFHHGHGPAFGTPEQHAMMLQAMLNMPGLPARGAGRGGRSGSRGGGRGGFNRGGMHGLEELFAHMQQQAQQAQDLGADLDVDNMSYEELLALQERVGHVSKGLSAAQIATVSTLCEPPSASSPGGTRRDDDATQCVICLTEFEASKDNDCRRVNVCRHVFHDVCLTRWLRDNRRCPICNAEVL